MEMPTIMPSQTRLTEAEAAKYIGAEQATLTKWRARGTGPVFLKLWEDSLPGLRPRCLHRGKPSCSRAWPQETPLREENKNPNEASRSKRGMKMNSRLYEQPDREPVNDISERVVAPEGHHAGRGLW